MKIQYLGHSCFRLISDMGTTVLCDPYKSDMVGPNMPLVRCDVVTVSHHHDDHDCMDAVMGNPAVIDCQTACCADDIAISSFPSFHDDEKGAKRGANLVFLFGIDGLKIVHMGDIGCFDEKIVTEVRGCDVLMLPVGGIYTADATTAKKYVDEIVPKIVLPMHYMTDKHKFQLDGLDKFVSLFDTTQIKIDDSYCLTLLDEPQNDRAEVIILQKLEDL